MPLTLTCQNCGREYTRDRGDEGRGLYCSRTCARAKQRRRTLIERFWRMVRTGDGCWEWQGQRVSLGYGRIADEHGARIMAHRLSWTIHNGPIPEGLIVRHTCDNPPCVRPDHLLVGTTAQNVKDRDDRHRRQAARGEANVQAILTTDAVRDIRSRTPARGLVSQLADHYGVSRATIRAVLEGRNWKHV